MSCDFSRFVLIFINMIFWGIAALFFFLGVKICSYAKSYENILDEVYTLLPAIIFIFCGILLFVFSLVGLCGLCRQKKGFLKCYLFVLLTILGATLTATIMACFFHGDITAAVKGGIDTAMHRYHDNVVYKHDMDFLQAELHCCGSINYTDWLNTQWYKEQNATVGRQPYPLSCCQCGQCNYTVNPLLDSALFTKGCYQLLSDEFESHLAVIIAIGFIFGVVLFIGLIASCVLIRRQQPKDYENLQETYA